MQCYTDEHGMTDHIVARMADLEARLGIEPIDKLLAERDGLVEQSATLYARHGAWGTWEHERKSKLAVIAALLRAQALRDNVKVTEASLVEAAHASSEYMVFVTEATVDRAELYRLESEIQNIDATIQRANMIGRYLASEARL